MTDLTLHRISNSNNKYSEEQNTRVETPLKAIVEQIRLRGSFKLYRGDILFREVLSHLNCIGVCCRTEYGFYGAWYSRLIKAKAFQIGLNLRTLAL